MTNACYAMRVRLESGDEPGYEPRLLVSSHLRGQEVAVVVSDKGTGIAEDILTSIFNPFFTTRSGALGAGLGLPLAADVVRCGGGALTVDTTFGSGSVFTATVRLTVLPGRLICWRSVLEPTCRRCVPLGQPSAPDCCI